MQTDAIGEIRESFTHTFPHQSGGKLHLVRTPGRVNLIGEHTDYNDGFVFPMAIEPEVRIAFRSRDDGMVRLASSVYPGETIEFSLQKKIARGKPAWANYVRGVAAELIAAGIPLSGMDAVFSNTLPVGGGLSSSAAVEVSTALALLTLAGLTMDRTRMAMLCQKAENEYAGVPCGIMDQTIVAGGKAEHAMLLDCRDYSKTFVKLDHHELRVVIVNSMVKHELSGGEYGQRRSQCEEGVAILKRQKPQIKALRDVTLSEIEEAKSKLTEVVYRRCRHVVSENARTVEAAKALSEQRYERAGELMLQSHNSLRDDYEVSCVELDFLVEEAMKVKGVYGARMTGGGFGGCIVALVQPRTVDTLIEKLHRAYTVRFERQPTSFVTGAAAGASVIE